MVTKWCSNIKLLTIPLHSSKEFCYKGEQRNEAVLEEVLGQVRLLQDGGDIYILMGMIPKKGKTNDAGERSQMKEKILEYARCYGIQYMS